MQRLYPLILLFSLLLCSCHDEVPVQPGSTVARRTVLIYMAAQNSLKKKAAADSTEIMNGRQYLADNDHLLLFIDDDSLRAPRLYRIARQWNKPHLVTTFDNDACSTSPHTLQMVLQTIKDKFPAQEYGLTLWSHADGWLPATNTDYDNRYPATAAAPARPFSFGIDTNYNKYYSDDGTQMNITDLAQVIQRTGLHFNYILFDACLMQNLEVDYALRNVTDYVVASPMAISTAGANYTNQLRCGLFAASPDSITRTYYNDVVNEYYTVYDDIGITISAVRTDQLPALATTLKEALPYSALANRQSPDMSSVLNYQTYARIFYYRPHNYDALQAFERLLPEPYLSNVLQALERCVTSHYSTPRIYVGPYNRYQNIPTATDHYRAVSLFIPQTIYTDNANKCIFGDLNQTFQQTEWYTACGMSTTGW